MCLSFPELRNREEEKSHLLTIPPRPTPHLREQATPSESAPKEPPLRTLLELRMAVTAAARTAKWRHRGC